MAGMTANTSKDEFYGLLQAAETARSDEIVQRAHAYTEADRQLDAEIDWKSMVVTEAVQLAARLDFLRRHPRLPALLGGSAVQVFEPTAPRGTDYITKPVLVTDTEHGSDDSVRSYFQFGIDFYTGSLSKTISYLKIFAGAEEVNSGNRTRKQIYEITASPTESRTFWKVRGAEIDAHIRGRQREITEKYKQQNPWVNDFMIFKPDGFWVAIEDGLPDDYKARDKQRKQGEQIYRELLPKLEAEDAEVVPLPEALYHFPLGLILQANEVFGTKNARMVKLQR
jgi:hypothetical protein